MIAGAVGQLEPPEAGSTGDGTEFGPAASPSLEEALRARRWLVARGLLRLLGASIGIGSFIFALPILLTALDPQMPQKELALMGFWALSLSVCAAWAAIRLKPGPLWCLVGLLPLPVILLAVLDGWGLDRRSVGTLLGCLFFEGLLVAGVVHLSRLWAAGNPQQAAARWEALSKRLDTALDGAHPQVAKGQAYVQTTCFGEQLLLKGPGYWALRPAQYHAPLGLLNEEWVQLESSRGTVHRVRIWAGTAGLVAKGPQSWVLEFSPEQWAKVEPYFPKEQS